MLVPGLFIAVAAVIWGVLFFQRAGLWGFLLATLVLGTVAGYALFRVGPLTSDRVLLAASLGIFAYFKYQGWCAKKPWTWIDLSVGLFLVGMTVTTFINDWHYKESAPLNKWLFFFALPSCMYLLGNGVTIEAKHLRWAYAVLAVFGIYLAFTSCAERFDLRWAVFPRYISDEKVAEFLGRGRGPLLNPSGNGILLTLGLSCALMFYPRLGRQGAILLAGAVLLYFAGIICTMTRCVWIGGMLAFGGILFLTMPRSYRLPAGLWAATLLVILVSLSASNLMSFKRDKNVSEADMRQSAKLRPMLAALAQEMFWDRPLLGCGTGQYRRYAGDYISRRQIDMPMEQVRPYVQHNIFLSLLVENGLITLVPFMTLLIHYSKACWQVWRDHSRELEFRQLGLVGFGFMCGYLSNGMFQDVLIIPMVNMYFFFLAGCLNNLNTRPQPMVAAPRVEPNLQSPLVTA